MTDNAALLVGALDQINRLVAAVPDSELHASTPCTERDTTELIEHLVVIADRVAGLLDPEAGPSSPTWTDAHARVRALVRTAAPAQVMELPFGRMPLEAGFGIFVEEFVTHGWDLAVAIRRTDLLDEELGRRAHISATARIPRSPRSHTPFADVVDVPDDGGAYDRLAGWMGRDPSWTSPAGA
jgi:uncharacterized protein (TIGR03086 family)